jgi:predicted RNA-binding Zn ribbon-like protein
MLDAPTPAFVFVGGRLWLDFVNTDDARLGVRLDTIDAFDKYVEWLEAAELIDAARASALRRRALDQPSGATAALVEARRIRAALRALLERGRGTTGLAARDAAVAEINRVLGRAVGTRRVDAVEDRYVRTFVPVGDVFGGLVIPIVESAVDSLVRGEFDRIRTCADRRCPRHFADDTKSHTRRWCDMRTCGNRAKAQRRRRRRA